MNIVGKSDLKRQDWNPRIIKVLNFTFNWFAVRKLAIPMAKVCTNLYSKSRKQTHFPKTTYESKKKHKFIT